MLDKFIVDAPLLTFSSACLCLHLDELLEVVFGQEEEAKVEKSRDLSSLHHTLHLGRKRYDP